MQLIPFIGNNAGLFNIISNFIKNIPTMGKNADLFTIVTGLFPIVSAVIIGLLRTSENTLALKKG
jgi:hypothetical protein